MRLDKYRENYLDYISTECNDRGEQTTNLTKQAARGHKKHFRKIKNKTLLVMKTDKSGKFCICTPEKFLEIGHVQCAHKE